MITITDIKVAIDKLTKELEYRQLKGISVKDIPERIEGLEKKLKELTE